jgi:hypothetical protein
MFTSTSTWEVLTAKQGQHNEAASPGTILSIIHLGDQNTLELARTPWKPQSTSSGLGPTGHVNLLLDVVCSYLSAATVYKRPSTLRARGMRSFPPSPRELLDFSAHLQGGA